MFANPFAAACAAYVAAQTNLPEALCNVESPPRRELGDYAIGCFPLAKAKGVNPAALATELAHAFTPTAEIAEVIATGPFLNFRLQRSAVLTWLHAQVQAQALLPQIGAGKTICIDYSSPNISKHLAYHHIRSTVIGHALAQTFRGLGYRVIGINHLGDWGTTHGMLIAAYKRWGAPNPDGTLDITGLNELYVRFREAMKAEPELEAEGRTWFKKLEDGDAEARALWQQFRDVSWAEFASVYAQMGIVFDEIRGESAYEPDMPGVMQELTQKGMVQESQGALVVELEGEKTPMLLMTKDGTTLYATRDIAAAKYRWQNYQFARSLYVVDRGQALHFRQLWKALTKAGYAWADKCEHVPFGLVRLGGKKTGTRTGNVVLLKDVLREATEDIAARMAQSSRELPPAELAAVATTVGIGAVMFANLVSQREKDVDFVWEKVLSFDGDSGPYLQYCHARCASILAKAGVTDTAPLGDARHLATDLEWAVARRVLDFPDIAMRAAAACEPHIICHFLLELAGDFSRWYTAGNGDANLRVLCDDAPTRTARLGLTATVKRTLAQGLGLLGMGAPDAM